MMAPAASADHRGRDGLREEERGLDVDRVDAVERVLVGRQRGAAREDTGVVHEDVDAPAQQPCRLFGERPARSRAAQVGVHVVRLAARVANARNHCLSPRVVTPGNDDVRAFAAERHGDLPADVARGTRDEGCLVLKSSCHGSDARNVFLDLQVQFSSGGRLGAPPSGRSHDFYYRVLDQDSICDRPC
jgi:hypothetical protein